MLLSPSTSSSSIDRHIHNLPERSNHERSRMRTFYRHQTVALKTGYLWQVEEGYFRTLTLTESGDIKTLGIWGTGDIIGIPLRRNYPFQIECLTTSKAFLIQDKSIFGGQWLVSYLQQTESLLAIQYQNLVRDRLILFLEWLGERFGYECERGTKIALRMTHQEISEAINSTRVTVTRMLRELEEDGFLGWSQRQCVLLK
ncbi:MAG: Crp/Fnr family transcriptional regulator [Synechococcus sp.]